MHSLFSARLARPATRPAISAGQISAAAVDDNVSRMLRASTIEVLESEYVMMARLKGLSGSTVLWRHALPNAIVPTLQVIALNLAWLAESPIIMLLSASTALARDWPSYRALRRFVVLLNGGVTLLLVLIVLPPVFRALAERLLGLPPEVARLAHRATLVLRLVSMTLAAAALALGTRLPGACIGALSLSAGVVAEAAASRWMARHVVRAMRAGPVEGPAPAQATLARFYFPLALTSMLAMCTGPLLILFMGRGAEPVACIAAWPVVQAFNFFFRSGGVAFQEVGVALRGPGRRPAEGVGRAALVLAAAVTAVLLLTACSRPSAPEIHSYSLGEKAKLGHIIYTVYETQWAPQLGDGPTARISSGGVHRHAQPPGRRRRLPRARVHSITADSRRGCSARRVVQPAAVAGGDAEDCRRVDGLV